MALILRILSIVALLACFLSLFVLGYVHWSFAFGNCAQEACQDYMVPAITLATVLIAVLTGGTALVSHRVAKRM